MIINVRGTNGSGKTTIARHLLHCGQMKPATYRANKRVGSYSGFLFGRRIVVLGSYEATCGGMDSVTDIREAADMIVTAASDPAIDVLFYEGLFISHMIGTVGAAVKPFSDRLYKCFLDTPLETCIERVIKRRQEKGNDKPFDPKNVIKDFRAVQLCRANCIKQGFTVVDLDHQRALYTLFDLIRTGSL